MKLHRFNILAALVMVLVLLLVGPVDPGRAQTTHLVYLPAVFKDFAVCATTVSLTTPANEAALNAISPRFEWDSGSDPNGTAVRIQVGPSQDLSTGGGGVLDFTVNGGQGSGQARLPENLTPNTTYYWRAQLQCQANSGPWTGASSFTTAASPGTLLGAPALTAPDDGSTTASPVAMQWQPVAGGTSYLLRYRMTGTLGYSFLFTPNTSVINSLSAGSYDWWVAAVNDYAIGAPSPTRQVTISGATPSALSAAREQAPVSGRLQAQK